MTVLCSVVLICLVIAALMYVDDWEPIISGFLAILGVLIVLGSFIK